ncbi:hypothetical protein NQ317_003403 [Molorchus minor]|uniref:RanBP2-type domain-containing protein n=1 Tax=Molorchus minor TaxID=1323400 RepID=A0ABQ9IXA8_9CUCU|nr:hypothetical protein NQ317_003403 [Molorchus minor]
MLVLAGTYDKSVDGLQLMWETYSGFYKHQIEANLVGAELMFEVMGYKHYGNGVLVLDGPICPDRVAAVSKDCLIAYVECQVETCVDKGDGDLQFMVESERLIRDNFSRKIVLPLVGFEPTLASYNEQVSQMTTSVLFESVLKVIAKLTVEQISSELGISYGSVQPIITDQLGFRKISARWVPRSLAENQKQIMKAIWEELSSSFKISWLEVLEFRKNHLCSPEQSVKALRFRHHQRQYQEHSRSYSQGSDPFNSSRCQPVPNSSTSPVLPVNHSFPPVTGLASHHHVGLPPVPQPVHHCMYTNGCCANSFPTYGSTYGYMPYASVVKANSNGYYYTNGFVTPPVPPGYPVPTGQLIELDPHNPGYDVETDKEDIQFEDWGYVYRNLESQGYYKDLGERGDILSPNSHKQSREGKKCKETDLDVALNNLTVTDRPLKMNEAVKKLDQEKKILQDIPKIDKQISPSSSYENVSPNDLVKKTVASKTTMYNKTKTLPREKNITLTERPVPSKIELKKVKEDKLPKTKEMTESRTSKSNMWQCKACTYLNEYSKEICDMCSKSRTTTLDHPMEIGGAECSKCTLVNPKELKVCDACGASLKIHLLIYK